MSQRSSWNVVLAQFHPSKTLWTTPNAHIFDSASRLSGIHTNHSQYIAKSFQVAWIQRTQTFPEVIFLQAGSQESLQFYFVCLDFCFIDLLVKFHVLREMSLQRFLLGQLSCMKIILKDVHHIVIQQIFGSHRKDHSEHPTPLLGEGMLQLAEEQHNARGR